MGFYYIDEDLGYTSSYLWYLGNEVLATYDESSDRWLKYSILYSDIIKVTLKSLILLKLLCLYQHRLRSLKMTYKKGYYNFKAFDFSPMYYFDGSRWYVNIVNSWVPTDDTIGWLIKAVCPKPLNLIEESLVVVPFKL